MSPDKYKVIKSSDLFFSCVSVWPVGEAEVLLEDGAGLLLASSAVAVRVVVAVWAVVVDAVVREASTEEKQQ